MAENEAAVAEQTEEDYQYQIKIEDAGPATKKSFEQVLAILRKTPTATLPSKRARLLAFVRSRIGAGADVDAEAMIERLENEGKIAVDDKWNVQYRL